MASSEAQKFRPPAPVTLAFVTVRPFPSASLSLHIDVSVISERVALEWVHNHISAFGGNPERVVL